MNRILFLFSLLTFFSSCGTYETSHLSNLTNIRESKVITIFALAGNSSCKSSMNEFEAGPHGSDIFRSLKSFLNELKMDRDNQNEIEYFTSCYNFGSSKISYVSSWDQNVVIKVSEKQARKVISRKMISNDSDEIIFLGHSYGGWLAMDILKNTDYSIRQLVTLDPISKKQCSFSTPAGCLQAPLDITNFMRSHIKSQTQNWANFYQTRTSLVHSGPILHADSNKFKNLRHTDMDGSESIWNDIKPILKPILKG